MLCKCYWIVLHIVHVTAFCLGGGHFSRHVYIPRNPGKNHKWALDNRGPFQVEWQIN